MFIIVHASLLSDSKLEISSILCRISLGMRLNDATLLVDICSILPQETADDLKKMYVYCRAVTIKPWSWKRQRQTTVSEMFSIGELSAIRHCRDSPKGAKMSV